MEYVPLRFKEKKERLVFTGGGIGVSVAALSCICGNGKCGSVTDLIWMVVPILAASLVKMSDTEKMFWKTGYGLTAVLALGIIGRLDGVAALTLLFLICVGGICRRQWQYPVIGILGVAMAYPTYMTWKHWLFDGSFAESGLEYTSIMEQGYSIGGLFSTYFYRNGHPGMGILLLGCLLFLLYQSFVKGKKICAKNDHIWLGAAHCSL